MWKTEGRSRATKAEYFLKKNQRKVKERFIEERNLFKDRVLEKLDINIEVTIEI